MAPIRRGEPGLFTEVKKGNEGREGASVRDSAARRPYLRQFGKSIVRAPLRGLGWQTAPRRRPHTMNRDLRPLPFRSS